MEKIVEAVVLAGGNDEDVEYAILQNVFIDRDEVEEHIHFNFEELTEEESLINFRFTKNHILRLVEVLRLPEVITDTRNKVTGCTALCVVLKRLSYPNRLRDIRKLFGYSPASLSQIINKTISIIIETHGHLLDNLDALQWLNREKIQYYAQAVRNKGAAIPNCWEFLDGTARQICRPGRGIQEEYYSGHKRFHCVKYQSLLCPDGIIVSLIGAYPGRRHDAGIFRDSRLYEQLERKAVFNDGEKYVIYGDQAYGVMELLLSPYHGSPANLAIYQRRFNESMKLLRISVEWGFQKIVSQFAFVDYKKNQKLLLQDVEAMYKVAVILTNCHTCLYGSQTAIYFDTIPPTLEEYVGL